MQQQRDKRDKLQRASVACFGSVTARALRGWRGVAARQQKMQVALQGHKVSGAPSAKVQGPDTGLQCQAQPECWSWGDCWRWASLLVPGVLAMGTTAIEPALSSTLKQAAGICEAVIVLTTSHVQAHLCSLSPKTPPPAAAADLCAARHASACPQEFFLQQASPAEHAQSDPCAAATLLQQAFPVPSRPMSVFTSPSTSPAPPASALLQAHCVQEIGWKFDGVCCDQSCLDLCSLGCRRAP